MVVQLQSILPPDADLCGTKDLYVHQKGNQILFDGYFNLFYIEKWRRYTSLEKLFLSISLRGYEGLALYHNKKKLWEKRLSSEKTRHYRIPVPIKKYDTGVFWFSLAGPVRGSVSAEPLVSGFYIGECVSRRMVGIGIDICTYHREPYVERTLRLLSGIMYDKTLDVSGHVHVYIVDNGRSLHKCGPVAELAGRMNGHVKIFSNRNAGGAGGFTRGMLEILKDTNEKNEKNEKNLTHVLLMDDDTRMQPDLLVRIYGFLSIVKEEWKDITLGGSMFWEDAPWMLYAAGERWERGIVRNSHKGTDMRRFKNAAGREMLSTEYECQYYSGWWCCCYSLGVVREDNLPLPVFLHHDDIEYGLRSRRHGIVFLNGVCVWHRRFERKSDGKLERKSDGKLERKSDGKLEGKSDGKLERKSDGKLEGKSDGKFDRKIYKKNDKRFDEKYGGSQPDVNLYYGMRNNLIEMALQYPVKKAAGYIRGFWRIRMAAKILCGRDREAFYALQAAVDFLKGPRWLWSVDPEQLHEKMRSAGCLEIRETICRGIEVYRRLCIEADTAVQVYQGSIKEYTTKKAWTEYLQLQD